MKLSESSMAIVRRYWAISLTFVVAVTMLAGWLIPSDYIDTLWFELPPPYDDMVKQAWVFARSPIPLIILVSWLVYGMPRFVKLRRLIVRDKELREFELDLPRRVGNARVSTVEAAKTQYEMQIWTIFRLRQRSQALRRQSTAILVMIAVSIASGIGVIIFAGYLTSIDSSGSAVQKAEAIVETLERDIARTNSRLRDAKLRLEAIRSDDGKTESAPKSDDFLRQQRLPATRQSRQGEVNDLEERLQLQKARMKRAERYLNEAYRSYFKLTPLTTNRHGARDGAPTELKQSNEEEELYGLSSQQQLLIASAITRFGVVAILLFFVGMLIGLYRYMSRLSAFYSGRADALMLCVPDYNRVISWMDLLAPKAIDFGRGPATPMDIAQQVAAAIIRRTPLTGNKEK